MQKREKTQNKDKETEKPKKTMGNIMGEQRTVEDKEMTH